MLRIIIFTIFVIITLNSLSDGREFKCPTRKELQTQIEKALRLISQAKDIDSLKIKVDAIGDEYTDGGGWTIVLRRLDGSVSFDRNWNEYKNGFGDPDGELFLGLDKIHKITSETRHELLVSLQAYDGEGAFEMYDNFAIGDENQQYELLTLGNAIGGAGDSLDNQLGMKFTTSDRDNDLDPRNCAKIYTGGWWYKRCHLSHLTGTYDDKTNGKGVNWYTFTGFEKSLKAAIMMIRPKK